MNELEKFYAEARKKRMIISMTSTAVPSTVPTQNTDAAIATPANRYNVNSDPSPHTASNVSTSSNRFTENDGVRDEIAPAATGTGNAARSIHNLPSAKDWMGIFFEKCQQDRCRMACSKCEHSKISILRPVLSLLFYCISVVVYCFVGRCCNNVDEDSFIPPPRSSSSASFFNFLLSKHPEFLACPGNCDTRP